MRLKGKPEPRDMGDEAGQDGEGLAGARGLATVEVYGHYGTCLNPAAPQSHSPACPAPPRHGGCHRHPKTQQISSTNHPQWIPTATGGREWGWTPSGSRPEREQELLLPNELLLLSAAADKSN